MIIKYGPVEYSPVEQGKRSGAEWSMFEYGRVIVRVMVVAMAIIWVMVLQWYCY